MSKKILCFSQLAQEKKQQAKDFNDNLRPPDATMIVGEPPYHYEYGFWRVDDGVIRLQKFSNGYSPWDQRADYTQEELDVLVKLAAQKPGPMEKK